MNTATVIPFAPKSGEDGGAGGRYRHAYQVAETITEFAKTVKLCGIFLGGVFVVAATIAYQLNRTWHSGFPVGSLSLLACAIFAVLASHVWEKVFQAQGQLLEMTVDSAVNLSLSLSNARRLAAMSYWQEARNATRIPPKAA